MIQHHLNRLAFFDGLINIHKKVAFLRCNFNETIGTIENQSYRNCRKAFSFEETNIYIN